MNIPMLLLPLIALLIALSASPLSAQNVDPGFYNKDGAKTTFEEDRGPETDRGPQVYGEQAKPGDTMDGAAQADKEELEDGSGAEDSELDDEESDEYEDEESEDS